MSLCHLMFRQSLRRTKSRDWYTSKIKQGQTQSYIGIVQGHISNSIRSFMEVGVNSRLLILFQEPCSIWVLPASHQAQRVPFFLTFSYHIVSCFRAVVHAVPSTWDSLCLALWMAVSFPSSGPQLCPPENPCKVPNSKIRGSLSPHPIDLLHTCNHLRVYLLICLVTDSLTRM